MRIYGAVPTAFWSNKPTQHLSDQAKLLAVYLLTGPHTNMVGCFRAPCGYLMEDLNWTRETVKSALVELMQEGFISIDEQSGWVLIHEFLKWNPIRNKKQGIGVQRVFETIPEHVLLIKPLAHALLTYSNHLTEKFISELVRLSQEESTERTDLNRDKNPVDSAILYPASLERMAIAVPMSLSIPYTVNTYHHCYSINDSLMLSNPSPIEIKYVNGTIRPWRASNKIEIPNFSESNTYFSSSLPLANAAKEISPALNQNVALDSIADKRNLQQEISTVFEHWKKTLHHPGAILDAKRKKLIQQALKMGYRVAQLCDAITGCSYTPHNMGDNDKGQRYHGLHVILRDADQIDRFIHNCHVPPKLQHPTDKLLQINQMAAQDWLQQKMQDINLYESN